ncbi:hypothetical protein OOK36_52665 [Streptomyces sp. NBC_00365]|uniref:AbiTii domain-containing protein n=1 Tax=Streptomyces sp. NBC_00365 TaxID=2975726 RepID=UPI00224F092D|nr:hypothetical protein [Streptomyces sp. NBC_00365]MCX5097188.1 hypothetical protein [Streptomyces sp. NBC_00365]
MILARVGEGTWQRLAPIAGPAPKSRAHPGRAHVVQDGTAHPTQVRLLTDAEAADWLIATVAGEIRPRLGHHGPRGGQPSPGRGMTKVTGVPVGQGRVDAVTTSDVRGLAQLERAVLDDTAFLASALRQCLMLGGYAHHEALRDWALKELVGYPAADELPSYRKVPAALEVAITLNLPGQIIQGSTRRISVVQLPQGAHERGLGESAPIRQGVRELEGLIAISDRTVHLSPPGSAAYVLEMTRQQEQNGHEFTEIMSLYWAIAKPSIEGVVDQVIEHARTETGVRVRRYAAKLPR